MGNTKTVPNKILKLFNKRAKLSLELMKVENLIDQYCEEIGVDFSDPRAALKTDIRIYCEFGAGNGSTLEVIKETLGIEEDNNDGRTTPDRCEYAL